MRLIRLDPYIQGFVSALHRTFSPWAFCRPPAYHPHTPPLGRFPRLDPLGQTSADFRALSDTVRLCACTMPGAVLGQAFQGVTPSFHLSEYQFYETDLFSKLLSIFIYFSQLHA